MPINAHRLRISHIIHIRGDDILLHNKFLMNMQFATCKWLLKVTIVSCVHNFSVQKKFYFEYMVPRASTHVTLLSSISLPKELQVPNTNKHCAVQCIDLSVKSPSQTYMLFRIVAIEITGGKRNLNMNAKQVILNAYISNNSSLY